MLERWIDRTRRFSIWGFIAMVTLGFLSACGGGDDVPGAPSQLAGVAGDGQATLTWTAASDADSYNLYWSNTAANNWGDDRLGSGVLAAGQRWEVTVDDGSGACRFDFMARLANGREIERRNVDVCAVYSVQFN